MVPLLSGERARGPEDNIQRCQPEQDQEPLPARHDARREVDEQTQVAEAAFEPGFSAAFIFTVMFVSQVNRQSSLLTVN